MTHLENIRLVIVSVIVVKGWDNTPQELLRARLSKIQEDDITKVVNYFKKNDPRDFISDLPFTTKQLSRITFCSIKYSVSALSNNQLYDFVMNGNLNIKLLDAVRHYIKACSEAFALDSKNMSSISEVFFMQAFTLNHRKRLPTMRPTPPRAIVPQKKSETYASRTYGYSMY